MVNETRNVPPKDFITPERVKALTPDAKRARTLAKAIITRNNLGLYIGARGPIDSETLEGSVALKLARDEADEKQEIRDKVEPLRSFRRAFAWVVGPYVSGSELQRAKDVVGFIESEQQQLLKSSYLPDHGERFAAISDATLDLFDKAAAQKLPLKKEPKLPKQLLEEWEQAWKEKVLG